MGPGARARALESASRFLQAVGTLMSVEVAAISFVGMAMLAAQNPHIGGGIGLALPAGALQQNLTVRISLPDLNVARNVSDFARGATRAH